MKYLLILSLILLASCSKSLEEVEHLVNSCKVVGGEPEVHKANHGYVEYVSCHKDGARYSNWKGKKK